MKPTHIKDIQSRSRHLNVDRIDGFTYTVNSVSDADQHHKVKLIPDKDGRIQSSCTCEWSQFRGVGCVHVMATLNHVAQKKGRKLSFWQTESDAKRQKNRTFELTGENTSEQVWITSRAS
jgi:hypothetical protein